MARVRQFAKDLGITYNQAKGLINKGRSRKDGGSQILEKVMKPKKYKPGGLNRTLLWPGSWLMARVCAKKGGGVPFCMHIKTNRGYMKMHQGTQLEV